MEWTGGQCDVDMGTAWSVRGTAWTGYTVENG